MTVVGTAVVARSMGAGEVVPGGEDTGDEGELLQPIGVKKERGSESDGETAVKTKAGFVVNDVLFYFRLQGGWYGKARRTRDTF